MLLPLSLIHRLQELLFETTAIMQCHPLSALELHSLQALLVVERFQDALDQSFSIPPREEDKR